MKPAIKKAIGITVAVAIVVVAGSTVLVYLVLGDMCGNETLSEFVSPDRTQKVVIFERGCGATTGFSWHASLLAADAKLPNESSNLFVANRGSFVLHAAWETRRHVLIKHDAGARVLKAERHLKGTEIRYVTF